jgi:hypothetical protein
MASENEQRPQRIRTPAFASRATVEAYLAAQVMPKWMERLREIHDELAGHRIRLERVYGDLRESCGDDLAAFAARWRDMARRWNFDYVNQLIDQHNDYYPIEANLPINPRTGDYVTVTGRSYRRDPLGPDWILDQFPAEPAAG